MGPILEGGVGDVNVGDTYKLKEKKYKKTLF